MLRILLILLMFSFTSMHAADEANENDQKNVEEQNTKEESSKQTTPKVITPDTFDPTEKLSEAIPAAFPVDI